MLVLWGVSWSWPEVICTSSGSLSKKCIDPVLTISWKGKLFEANIDWDKDCLILKICLDLKLLSFVHVQNHWKIVQYNKNYIFLAGESFVTLSTVPLLKISIPLSTCPSYKYYIVYSHSMALGEDVTRSRTLEKSYSWKREPVVLEKINTIDLTWKRN